MRYKLIFYKLKKKNRNQQTTFNNNGNKYFGFKSSHNPAPQFEMKRFEGDALNLIKDVKTKPSVNNTQS